MGKHWHFSIYTFINTSIMLQSIFFFFLVTTLLGCGKETMPVPIPAKKTQAVLATYYKGSSFVFTWHTNHPLSKKQADTNPNKAYITKFTIYIYPLDSKCSSCTNSFKPKFTLTLHPQAKLVADNQQIDSNKWKAYINKDTFTLIFSQSLFKATNQKEIIETSYLLSNGDTETTNLTLFHDQPSLLPITSAKAIRTKERDPHCVNIMNPIHSLRKQTHNACPLKAYMIIKWTSFLDKHNINNKLNPNIIGDTNYFVNIYFVDTKTNTERLIKRAPALAHFVKLKYMSQPLRIRFSDRFNNESKATTVIFSK